MSAPQITTAEAALLAIDITGIELEPEPMGRGWQAWAEGDRTRWSRGNTQDEAVGSLIRRLATELQGANWRRSAKEALAVGEPLS